MKSAMKVLTLGLVLFVFGACNGGDNSPNLELFQGMMDQINVKSQDWDPDVKGMTTDRVPPEGTIAQGKKPYAFAGDAVGSDRNPNPHKDDSSPEFILKGKERYEIYCSVCHGTGGKGDGSVAAVMAIKPPSLLSDKVRALPDGRIFHIITEGQGVMGPYAGQIIFERDRWAVVNYVRTLQNKGGAN